MAEKFASKADDDIATMLADKDSISTKKIDEACDKSTTGILPSN